MFTPIALGGIAPRPHQHFHRGASRGRLDRAQQTSSSRPFDSPQDAGQKNVDVIAKPSKVLQTISFDEVRARLHALRRYRRQKDHIDGDIGDADVSEEEEDLYGENGDTNRPFSNTDIQAAGHTSHKKDVAHTGKEQDSIDFGEEGDLSLPPPAMDLPDEHRSVSSGSRRRRVRAQRDAWHMSDVPLTPKVQMARASEFSRGLEASSPIHTFSPVLETHAEVPLATEQQAEEGTSDLGGQQEHISSQGSARTKYPSPPTPGALPSHDDSASRDAAWWLDISCPTYRDMTELSKMFPLHPLTVEDVLQQDTQEKVEMFDRLGYYFVVIRAIDERYFKYTSASAATSAATVLGTSASPDKQSQPLYGEQEHGSIELKVIGDAVDGTESKLRSSGQESDLKAEEEISSQEDRASDSAGVQQRPRVDIIEGTGGKEGVEGIGVGAINLYLVVFRHGVISFHFEDISKHANRVRDRVIDLSQPVELTSGKFKGSHVLITAKSILIFCPLAFVDWIAHGLFDSVIDSFFPLLSFVEGEVDEIERLTSEPLPSTRAEMRQARKAQIVGVEGGKTINDKRSGNSLPLAYLHAQHYTTVLRPLPRIAVGTLASRLLPSSFLSKRLKVSRMPIGQEGPPEQPRSFIQRVFRLNRRPARVTAFLSESAVGQSTMLRRITDTRKITTGLSRLLVPKNDSVRGLRKRLVDLRGPSASQEEMSIYMGDVHDHIATLLTQLAASDYHLGDIHFSYLSSLRIMNNRVSHSTDEILIVLATITITIFAVVLLITIFSINVHVPRNELESSDHAAFFAVLGGVCCVPPLIAFRAWLWIKQAKAKTSARRAVR